VSRMMERVGTLPARRKDPGSVEPDEPLSLRREAAGSDDTPSGWLPPPRGPLSASILGYVTGTQSRLPANQGTAESAHLLGDDDLHVALYLCYELHYRGLPGVPDALEWDLELLRFRADLERRFEQALREAVHPQPLGTADVPRALRRMAREDVRPSLSRFIEREATPEQVKEFMILRSAYHLKEADPHSFAIPRLHGRAKAALIEIQADEYGGGRERRMHATLFAESMRALGLEASYGAYVGSVPGVGLALVNAMSMFGLHRRLRGALVGQLALFELTSTQPNRRYGNGLRRLGMDSPQATRFFDEHVEADAVHEAIAANDLAGSLVDDEPALAADVVFGAGAQQLLDHRCSEYLIGRWSQGASGLLRGGW
jgi:hypothetical protein